MLNFDIMALIEFLSMYRRPHWDDDLQQHIGAPKFDPLLVAFRW